MAGESISPPGVDVIQEFVAAAPTPIAPFMPTVFVGPAIQLIDAFDDLGNPQSEALAGTYRDGLGVIAYDLPSLAAEASTVGFEDDVRVFLVYGAVTDELNALTDEEVIVNDGTGDFTLGSPDTFTDVTQLFVQVGVEVGDMVRVSYRGETLDIEITAVTSDTILELASSVITEASLVGLTYDIVRNPAEFVFDAVQQANIEIGNEADYIRFTAQLLKVDAVTVGDFIGSTGDTLSLVIEDSAHFLDGVGGVIGDSIFTSALATFLTDVGVQGAVTGELIYLGAGADDSAVFRDVLEVVTDTQIHIETGSGVDLTTETYHVGDDSGATFTAATGATNATVGTGCILTVTGGNFITSIGGIGAAPANTFVELSFGVYLVEAVNSDSSLDIFSTAGSASLAGEDPVFLMGVATQADGATGGLDDFASLAQDLTTIPDETTKSVNIAGLTAGDIISVTDEHNAILGVGSPNPLVSGPTQVFSVVDETAPLTLTFDPADSEVVVQLERGRTDNGMTASTYAEVEDAIVTALNASYNVLVTDQTDAALGGTTGTGLVDLLEADLGTFAYDGGSNDSQILLDGDLLGSTTPTASVYVSYKALQIGLSDQAALPQMWFIDSQTTREAILGAATQDNPLSLAVSFGLINSPSRGVWALGVSEITAAKPNGTVAAYTSAFEFLEGENVYTLVPVTIDLTVAQILQAHVTAMSLPSEKAERIGFFNSALPLFKNATVVASGTSGNTGVIATVAPAADGEFATSVDLVAAGALENDILVVSAIADSASSPQGVNGTVGPLYGIRLQGVKTGDDFVADLKGADLETDAVGAPANLTNWNSQVDVSWTLYRAGSAITQSVDQAEVIAETSEGYADRRMYHHWPDQGTADVNGTESLIDGSYIAASWGGRTNEAPPEQGFSRTNIAGWTGVKHSNGYFSKSQLNRMAGGGTFITIQESQNAPLRCRHQLSTDTSSVVKQELSITRVIDYVAKFLRQGLDRQVGKFNITKSYMDGLSTALQGLLRALEESGRVVKAELAELKVNANQPDKVDVTIAIDVPFPANYIEITLQV